MTTEGIGDGSFFSRFGSVLGMEVEENHRFVRNLGHNKLLLLNILFRK